MKKSILSGTLCLFVSASFVLIFLLGSLSSCDSAAKKEAQRIEREKQVADSLKAAAEKEEQILCDTLISFLKSDITGKSKVAKANAKARVIGIKKADALPTAMKMCIKLDAKKLEMESKDVVYKLPGHSGHFTIQEVNSKDIYLKLIIDSECSDLPFSEIWMVSPQYYKRQ
ncbi:MAG: hypothetical protein E6767_12360 [Dysgonomonas sp.]|nr:hypothetical protein [Dysgonomonas sp.]